MWASQSLVIGVIKKSVQSKHTKQTVIGMNCMQPVCDCQLEGRPSMVRLAWIGNSDLNQSLLSICLQYTIFWAYVKLSYPYLVSVNRYNKRSLLYEWMQLVYWILMPWEKLSYSTSRFTNFYLSQPVKDSAY